MARKGRIEALSHPPDCPCYYCRMRRGEGHFPHCSCSECRLKAAKRIIVNSISKPKKTGNSSRADNTAWMNDDLPNPPSPSISEAPTIQACDWPELQTFGEQLRLHAQQDGTAPTVEVTTQPCNQPDDITEPVSNRPAQVQSITPMIWSERAIRLPEWEHTHEHENCGATLQNTIDSSLPDTPMRSIFNAAVITVLCKSNTLFRKQLEELATTSTVEIYGVLNRLPASFVNVATAKNHRLRPAELRSLIDKWLNVCPVAALSLNTSPNSAIEPGPIEWPSNQTTTSQLLTTINGMIAGILTEDRAKIGRPEVAIIRTETVILADQEFGEHLKFGEHPCQSHVGASSPSGEIRFWIGHARM